MKNDLRFCLKVGWNLIFLLGLIFSFSPWAVAQVIKSYFEQQGNTISIEAEEAFGYGWINTSVSAASGGKTLFYPKVDTLNVPVADDVYIDYYNPNTNFGTSTQLFVDGQGGTWRGTFYMEWGTHAAFEKAAFLKFNVTNLSEIIIEAFIYLYCESGSWGGGIYALDPLLDDLNWSENQATWNNKPSKHYDGNTFHDYVGPVSAGNWYKFDVTSELFGKMNGSYSFGIVMQENNITSWSSKEGSHPPYLMLRVISSSAQHMVSGNTLYFSNNAPINEATVNLWGALAETVTSNLAGYYEFLDLIADEDYYINASKPAETDIGDLTITTYDAAMTAQAAVGIRVLTDFQKLAADANKDGEIYTYDAALIAQYAVGLPKRPESHVAEWTFVPSSLFIESLSSDLTNQTITGIILGNVHGGWTPSSALQRYLTTKEYSKLPDMKAQKGDQILIPLEVDKNKELISAAVDFRYDPSLLRFNQVLKTDLSYKMELFYNNEQGRLRVGAYGTQPINEPGVLIFLSFYVIASSQKNSLLNLAQFQLNDNVFMSAKSVLTIEGESEKPLTYDIDQNYPNPFFVPFGSNNRGTIIPFQIPLGGTVRLKVYNYLGQEVKSLLSDELPAGSYRAMWDGRDNNGEYVSAGTYLYRLEAGDFVKMKRLVLLR